MTHILAIRAGELIQKASEELQKQKLVQPPEWSQFVKTGRHKERTPDLDDWWYTRAAAILRRIAKLGPVGTQKLRTKYGGKKRRGYQPEKFFPASGSIIRKILQQLEKSKLIKQTTKGVHKGRVLTPEGQAFLDKIAVQLAKKAHKEKTE
ncbi:30S ribosomal protein S19e [Candidatus Woesearchaeota archaeon]|nr:30S ribosomal protein S19e [Candidatus Woesearchaeota archaeon]